MKHRPYFQRVTQVLTTVGIAFGILAAAPMAEAFRTVPGAPSSGSRVPLAQLETGDLVARLSIPRLAIDAPVYEGVLPGSLARGAGHVPGTAIPGEEGGANHCVVVIPRDSAAAAAVADARLGESITMRTPFGVQSYRVVEKRVLFPEAVPIGRTRKPRITLVTPYPVDEIGPAPLRMAVALERDGGR
jgi:sortase A